MNLRHKCLLAGLSMEGDEALLADMDVKVEKKRDEWMTTLPPERKVCISSNLAAYLSCFLTSSYIEFSQTQT